MALTVQQLIDNLSKIKDKSRELDTNHLNYEVTGVADLNEDASRVMLVLDLKKG